MIKRKAKELAYAGTITFGELQELIDNCDTSKPCKVNKNLTRQQALSIMGTAIKDKDPEERPITTWFNRRDKLTLTGDGINVMNILIECG